MSVLPGRLPRSHCGARPRAYKSAGGTPALWRCILDGDESNFQGGLRRSLAVRPLSNPYRKCNLSLHQSPKRPVRTHHEGRAPPSVRAAAVAASTSAIGGAITMAAASRSLRSDANQVSRASRLAFSVLSALPVFGDGGVGETGTEFVSAEPHFSLPEDGEGKWQEASAGVAYRSPGASPSALNTDPVGTATPGWTMRMPSFGRVAGAESISPMPRIMRGRGSRQTGISAPVARAAS